jgi:hypothetical protein
VDNSELCSYASKTAELFRVLDEAGLFFKTIRVSQASWNRSDPFSPFGLRQLETTALGPLSDAYFQAFGSGMAKTPSLQRLVLKESLSDPSIDQLAKTLLSGSGLTSLSLFSFTLDRFTSSFGSALCQLPKLTDLTLSTSRYEDLSEVLPFFPQLKLKSLHLLCPPIDLPLFSSVLGELPLENLKLGCFSFQPLLWSALSRLSSTLSSLSLYGCVGFTLLELSSLLGSCSVLHTLSLDRCPSCNTIDSTAISGLLTALCHTQIADLSLSMVKPIVQKAIADGLPSLPTLRRLSLRYDCEQNEISDSDNDTTDHWNLLFASLSRSRINRLNLIVHPSAPFLTASLPTLKEWLPKTHLSCLILPCYLDTNEKRAAVESAVSDLRSVTLCDDRVCFVKSGTRL